MKNLLITGACFVFLATGCKKDSVLVPEAFFTFAGDNLPVLRMATYDTCTLINNSTNSDSCFWNFGNGNFSTDNQVVLSYPVSGTYTVTLTAKNKNGLTSVVSKKVIVLNRVLKKVIIKSVYWDTIPNAIPGFNAVWPQSSRDDIFVQVQKRLWTDSIVPISGILPNSPILYKSPYIHNVFCNTTVPIEFEVPVTFIIDKKMVLNRNFALSLGARDSKGTNYCLLASWGNGVVFGIKEEDFANNTFTLTCSFLSAVELYCDFE